jgi:hypothetical protein
MSDAFCCDLCDQLEVGKPSQRLTVKPAMGHSEDLDCCSDCLVSHNDWRVSRAPMQDQPDIELPDDLPSQERYA